MCVTKMVCDKDGCEKRCGERWCVTKMGVKEVCERWCVTKKCDKDGVSQSVCERWHLVCERWCDKEE